MTIAVLCCARKTAVGEPKFGKLKKPPRSEAYLEKQMRNCYVEEMEIASMKGIASVTALPCTKQERIEGVIGFKLLFIVSVYSLKHDYCQICDLLWQEREGCAPRSRRAPDLLRIVVPIKHSLPFYGTTCTKGAACWVSD